MNMVVSCDGAFGRGVKRVAKLNLKNEGEKVEVLMNS